MKYRRQGRRERVDRLARRAALRITVVTALVLVFGLVVWLLAGRPHRHGRRWHWKDN